MTTETIDLKNKVVAVFDDAEAAASAAAEVSGLGHNVTVLEGEDGQARLPHNQEGLTGALKTAAAAFGDELRVLYGLDESLSQGAQVLVVDVTTEQADKVVAKLDQQGGRFVWSFGEWTFKPVAPEANEEDTA